MSRVLSLSDYRGMVALDTPFDPPKSASDAHRPELVEAIVEYLVGGDSLAGVGVDLDELPEAGEVAGRRRLLGTLLTLRGPEPLTDEVNAMLDHLLQSERAERGGVDGRALPRVAGLAPGSRYGASASVALWRGDITTLSVDAIVNAGNAALLGCFRPHHACVDNAIHSAAGPRLREDCGRIIAAQGHPEPTGNAKATRGYNLPARFVLHTVGPIVGGSLGEDQEEALASCYRSCLQLATALPAVRTIAFCAISTGVFGFPKAPAARVATRAVAEWLAVHPGELDLVVFNVFTEEDEVLYRELLGDN